MSDNKLDDLESLASSDPVKTIDEMIHIISGMEYSEVKEWDSAKAVEIFNQYMASENKELNSSKNYFQDYLQGKVINTAIGLVRINSKSKGKIHDRMRATKYLAIPYIPEILIHGEISEFIPLNKERTDSAEGYYEFSKEIQTEFAKLLVRIKVSSDKDGNLLYYLASSFTHKKSPFMDSLTSSQPKLRLQSLETSFYPITSQADDDINIEILQIVNTETGENMSAEELEQSMKAQGLQLDSLFPNGFDAQTVNSENALDTIDQMIEALQSLETGTVTPQSQDQSIFEKFVVGEVSYSIETLKAMELAEREESNREIVVKAVELLVTQFNEMFKEDKLTPQITIKVRSSNASSLLDSMIWLTEENKAGRDGEHNYVEADQLAVSDAVNSLPSEFSTLQGGAPSTNKPDVSHDRKEGKKLLLLALKKAFIGTKFSVTKSYSGYEILWTDGPSVALVKQITDHFESRGSGHMDPYSDYWESGPTKNAVNANGETVNYGIGEIRLSRRNTDEFVKSVLATIHAQKYKEVSDNTYVPDPEGDIYSIKYIDDDGTVETRLVKTQRDSYRESTYLTSTYDHYSRQSIKILDQFSSRSYGENLLDGLNSIGIDTNELLLDRSDWGEDTEETYKSICQSFINAGFVKLNEGGCGFSSGKVELPYFYLTQKLYSFRVSVYSNAKGDPMIASEAFNGTNVQKVLQWINTFIPNEELKLKPVPKIQLDGVYEDMISNFMSAMKPETEQGAELFHERLKRMVARRNPDEAPELTTITIPDALAQSAATSDLNAGVDPTPEELEANQYATGKFKINNLDIEIENPIGTTRSGTSANGEEWSTEMKAHYGFIANTLGNDGDEVDVFVAPGVNPDYDGKYYVIYQNDEKGNFDEHKIIIGVSSKVMAAQMYHEHYDANWSGMGSIVEYDLDGLNRFLEELKQENIPRFLNKTQLLDSWAADGIYEFVPKSKIVVNTERNLVEAKISKHDPVVLFSEHGKLHLIHGKARLELADKQNERMIPAIIVYDKEGITWQIINNAIKCAGSPCDPEALGVLIEKEAEKQAIQALA